MENRSGAGFQRASSSDTSLMRPRRIWGVAASRLRQGNPLSSMKSSYDVLAAIDVDGVGSEPVGGGVAEGGDAAGHVLGGGEAVVRVALFGDFDELFVASVLEHGHFARNLRY